MSPAARVYINDRKNRRNTNTAYNVAGFSLKISADMTIHKVVVRANGTTRGISCRRVLDSLTVRQTQTHHN